MDISELKQQVRSVFDPLANRLGLIGPTEASIISTEFDLSYSTQTLGLEITVDMSDFFIYALIYRPQGIFPPIGYDDEQGKRHKLYLQQALKELGIDTTRETRALQKLSGNIQNRYEMAGILAQLLERNWPLLLSNQARWFR
jgi:hypothetical protein